MFKMSISDTPNKLKNYFENKLMLYMLFLIYYFNKLILVI